MGAASTLSTVDKFHDFELELDYKLDEAPNAGCTAKLGEKVNARSGQMAQEQNLSKDASCLANSGIYFRSGYQLNLGRREAGEYSRRRHASGDPGESIRGNVDWLSTGDCGGKNRTYLQDCSEFPEIRQKNDWNHLRVMFKGERLQIWLNDKQITDVTDKLMAGEEGWAAPAPICAPAVRRERRLRGQGAVPEHPHPHAVGETGKLARVTMIPAAKQAVVARALQQAFGTTDIDDIRPETGGLSGALIFRIVVKGAPYLLRVVTRDALWQSPSNEFSSMQKAADAGIAPRIRYANAEDRVLISDFVESQPFPEDLATRIAPVLRTLHALPGFPHPSTGPYLDFVDRLVREFRAAGFLPAHRTDELLDRYARVTEVYPRNDDLVASHNDLKPDNILFDGDRVWLVDWEAAFLNDRFVDLAMVANFFVTGEDAGAGVSRGVLR